MGTNTASERTVFVLGKEEEGNRVVSVVESGEEYSMDITTAVTYTVGNASFPYIAD